MLSGGCARYPRLASWAKAPKDGARLTPVLLVECASLEGVKPSSCIKRCTRGFGRIPSLLLLMMESEEEETEDIVRRRLRRCVENEESVFNVEELGVEGVVKDGTAVEGGGEVQ